MNETQAAQNLRAGGAAKHGLVLTAGFSNVIAPQGYAFADGDCQRIVRQGAANALFLKQPVQLDQNPRRVFLIADRL